MEASWFEWYYHRRMAAACELPYSRTAQQSAKQQNTGALFQGRHCCVPRQCQPWTFTMWMWMWRMHSTNKPFHDTCHVTCVMCWTDNVSGTKDVDHREQVWSGKDEGGRLGRREGKADSCDYEDYVGLHSRPCKKYIRDYYYTYWSVRNTTSWGVVVRLLVLGILLHGLW